MDNEPQVASLFDLKETIYVFGNSIITRVIVHSKYECVCMEEMFSTLEIPCDCIPKLIIECQISTH